MTLALILLLVSFVLELLASHLKPRWRLGPCLLAVALLLAASVMMLLAWLNVATLLLSLLSAYRLFNIARIVKGRMHAQYLRMVTGRTTIILLGMQMLILLVWVLLAGFAASLMARLYIVSIAEFIIVSLILGSVYRKLHVARSLPSEPPLHGDLPTVTVAIPARNETDDLEACLQTIVASNYPKLEVIVLDDCSQMRQTPEIIRQFAHAGVRFVPGEPPRQTWLAKNHAYDRLYHEASGEFLLFCGVDVRFEVATIRDLVIEMQGSRLDMLSVMPRNMLHKGKISLPQVMRYARELIRSSLFRQEPVFSSCWVIRRDTLAELGGLASVSRTVSPEIVISGRVASRSKYAFIDDGRHFGVTTVKSIGNQENTAIRTLYPGLHKRPEAVAATGLLELLLLLPVMQILYAAYSGAWLLLIAGVVVLIGEAITYYRLIGAMYGSVPASAVLTLPVALTRDLELMHLSMYRYEFTTVEWKGRNICLPVMHTVPHSHVLNK